MTLSKTIKVYLLLLFVSPFSVSYSSTSKDEEILITKESIGIHRDGPIPLHKVTWIVDEVKKLGATWLRINLVWTPIAGTKIDSNWSQIAIEKEKGQYDWVLFDSVINEAERKNIHLLINIRGYSQSTLYENSDRKKTSAYQQFISSLVHRYKKTVKHWQIENEILSQNFWRGSIDDYVEVLRIASSTIRSEDPTAQIVLAGVQSSLLEDIIVDTTALPGRLALQKFRRYLKEGLKYADIVDAHFYHNPMDIPRKMKFYKSIMRDLGSIKDIWVTENGGPDSRFLNKKYTDETHASEIYKRYLLSLYAGASKVFWHNLEVLKIRNDVWSQMALIVGDKPRPAYYAYQQMVLLLGADTTTLAKVDYRSNVTAFSLRKKKSEYAIIWSDKQEIVRLPYPKQLISFIRMNGDNGVLQSDSIEVTVLPLILRVPKTYN